MKRTTARWCRPRLGNLRLEGVARLCGLTLLALFLGPTMNGQAIFQLRHSNPVGGTLRAIAASNAMLVAVGDDGRVLTSPNAIAWTAATVGASDTLRGIIWDGARFVAVGDHGRVVVSADGVTWAAGSVGLDVTLNALTVVGGRYVAVGEKGVIVTSTDAATWQAANSGTSVSLRGVGGSLKGGGVVETFAACGDAGVILTSGDGGSAGDGLVWTKQPVTTTHALTVVTSGGIFAGEQSSAFSAHLLSYRNPPSWDVYDYNTSLRGTATGDWRGAAQGDGGTIFVGDNGQAAVEKGTFQNYEAGTTEDLKAACFARGVFFAVGAHETILQGAAPKAASLLNASTRSQISEGSGALIGGFVIAGTGTQGLLIRAVGPSLMEFGIGAPLARPVLTVYDAAGRVVAANAGWAASPDQSRIVAAAKTVGAFALPETSLDSAVVIRLPPGSYTAVVTGAPAGIGLLEMYDTDRWPIISNTQFTNLSCRGMVGTGQASLIAGLGLASRNPRLIRAVGPGLRAFGIEGVLADPRIDLVRPQVAIGGGLYTNQRYAPAMTVATNDDWHVPLPPATDDPANSIASLGSVAELMTATQKVGAFPLAGGSRDAALDVTLNSAVTIQVTGADGGSGIALVEVYEVGSR